MKTFLGRNCFAGETAAYAGSFLSQASFTGCIVFTNWNRADVKRLLPAELELAVNLSATRDVHPVVLMFGVVAEGAATLAGFTVPLGVRYAEFALAIPFVRHNDEGRLHTYIPRMYSNHLPATWTGNTFYGFGKEVAKMWWQGPVFMLTREDDALLLHAAIESRCDWLSGPRCTLPNFEAMRAVFALPIVGRKADGVYVCSYFDWDFNGACVRAADSCVTIDAPILEGLTPRRCYGVRAGTFQVERMLWRLSWPSSCHFR
jgi:hypothetical protein